MKRNWLVISLAWLLLLCLLSGCGGVTETEGATESEEESEVPKTTESVPPDELESSAETEREDESIAESETEKETESESEAEAEEPAELWEEGGSVLKLYSKEKKTRAILYQAPDESFLGDAYTVELSLDGETWYPLDVWTAKVAVQVFGGIYENYITYFVNFDFDGEALLRVTPQKAGAVEIRPAGWVKATADGGATVIRVDEACQFSFEVDGDIYGNLQVFANPIEEIDKNDPQVIYLEAGLYTAENCDLIEYAVTKENGVTIYTPELHVPTGKTLYLSGGAVVRARVVVKDCEHAAVKGRGVLDLLPWNRENNLRASEDWAYPNGFRVENSQNITLEGIIVRNSLGYSIYAGNTNGLVVDNIKAISAAQWSDGFDSMATSNVVIKNCFFRTNDDCIAIYGSRWNNKGDSRNYEVYDCILWADNAHAINMGNHGSNDPANPDIIENIRFHDIEILEVHSINWTGAFSVMCGGENILRNVTVERVNVEFSQSDLIRLRFTRDSEHYGTVIENFTFRDIYFEPKGVQEVGVYLQGQSKARPIKGIIFENVWIGNQKITATSPLLHKNLYVSGLTFR